MPRRRNATLVANERSATGAGDKKYSMHASKSKFNGSDSGKTAGSETTRKLAALDNLHLALSLDLMDDDGDDPYFALEEYLEKAKVPQFAL